MACGKSASPDADTEDAGDQSQGPPPDDGQQTAEAGDEPSSRDAGGTDTAADVAPEPEAGTPDTGNAARCDRTKPFGAPTAVTSVNSAADESSARLSPDELSLYLGSARRGTYDMFVATRASVSADFSAPAPLANLSTGNQESHGIVTADGLTMYLGWSSPGGSFHLAVSVRPAVVADFGAPQLVANVNSGAIENDPMIDEAGQNIYFTSTRAANNVDIYQATKTAAGAFGAPTALPGIDSAATEHMPVITPDGLTLYFASNRGGKGDDIWVARRPSAAQPFLAPVLEAELNSAVDDAPTWVSSDECTIYIRRGATNAPRDIFVASRPK